MILRPSGPAGGTASRESSGLPSLREDSRDTISSSGLGSDTTEIDEWDSEDDEAEAIHEDLVDALGAGHLEHLSSGDAGLEHADFDSSAFACSELCSLK